MFRLHLQNRSSTRGGCGFVDFHVQRAQDLILHDRFFESSVSIFRADTAYSVTGQNDDEILMNYLQRQRQMPSISYIF